MRRLRLPGTKPWTTWWRSSDPSGGSASESAFSSARQARIGLDISLASTAAIGVLSQEGEIVAEARVSSSGAKDDSCDDFTPAKRSLAECRQTACWTSSCRAP